MIKAEIMNALNRCEPYVVPACCCGCPYNDCWDTKDECITQLHSDAFGLLKAQEPRVMSVQEVKQLKHGVLVAYEARGLRLGDDGKHHMTIVCHAAEFETIDSRGVIWFHGGIGIEGFKNYGRVFRVWTSLPTEEQRKEAKWSAGSKD